MTDRGIHQVNIEREMRDAYLSYAMSVIVARALPDARDGLKPVHRRILYAMHDMGLGAAGAHKKSARIVGEVLGKYHPHGDGAVYDTMVRMAQDFSMRYMLIDGQGNFGSIDGDGAAAMRYTEARMAKIGGELLVDIGKDTVDFVENFDGTLDEPSVLPAQVPNLLVNGASGIAVGMSTNIPPHNLGEICDALIYMLREWGRLDDIGVDDLMRFVQGPDFPTGGVIYRERGGEDMLRSAYETGRGKMTLRAKVHIEDMGRGKSRIIVSELPFQTNKTALIERIAALVSNGKLEGLADLRDESDRQNSVRLVIELQRGADARKTLAALFKLTPLQSTFGLIMLALVDGQPRSLSLMKALRVYLEHRLDVVLRRSRFDLERARERAHVLDGLIVALDNLDAVIATIRKSRRADTARRNLVKGFDVSEAQAGAILDMPLRRLAALEIKQIRDEHKQTLRLIGALESLLASPAKQRGVIIDELGEIQARYSDFRRSVVVNGEAGFATVEDFLVPDEATWVIFGANGKLCRTAKGKRPRISGAAKRAPRFIHQSSILQTLYLFTSGGLCATIPVHQLPRTVDVTAGARYDDLCALSADDEIVAMVCLPATPERGYLFLATAGAQVKRLRVTDLPGVVTNAFSIIKLGGDDRLLNVRVTDGDADIVMTTARGYSIRFREAEVTPAGLNARGVRGMDIGDGRGPLVGAAAARQGEFIWHITNDGRARRKSVEQVKRIGRAGRGAQSMQLASQDRSIVAATVGAAEKRIALLTSRKRARILTIGETPLNRDLSAADEPVIDLHDKEDVIAAVEFQANVAGPPKQAPVPEAEAEAAPASQPRKQPTLPGRDFDGGRDNGANPKASENGAD